MSEAATSITIDIDEPTSPIAWLEPDASSGVPGVMDIYLSVNPESRRVRIIHQYQSQNSVPEDVWHHRRFLIGLPDGVDAQWFYAQLMTENIRWLIEHICEGYESHWDGSNHVGTYTGDADRAIDQLRQFAEDALLIEDGGAVEIGDWLDPVGSWDVIRDELGMNAETTDEEIARMVESIEKEAREQGYLIVDDTERYLRMLRDAADED